MITKVPVERLQIGVYVEKIDRSWISTPFLANQFEITSEGQIEKLKEYDIEEVYIDTERGLDVSSPEEVVETRESIEYFGIPSEKFLVDTVVPFNLYLKQDRNYRLYLRKGLPFRSELQLDLESNGINTVYIFAFDKIHLGKFERKNEEERKLSQKGLSASFKSQAKVKRYNDYLNNYMPVDSNIFVPSMKVPFNLFEEQDTVVSQFLKAESIVSEKNLFSEERMKNSRKNILIHLSDKAVYKNFLKELASRKTFSGSQEASRVRAAVVRENSKLVTKDLMDNPRSGETIKEVGNTVSDMIQSVLENPASFYGLMKINTYDYYTYLHSVNVCTLAIGLAVSLGLKKEDLFNLAVGTLMHDVGKSQVSSGLINKPGKLTDQEFVSVKQHVVLGYGLMKDHKELSKDAFIPLLQHHEKLNGKGYPKKLVEKQLHLFGRISSIVDIYDALTTERAYKKAFKPFDAVNFLARNTEQFDQDVFRNFVVMLGVQGL